MNKVVITKIPTLPDYIVTAQFEHDKLVLLDCDNRKEKSILNNIYIGKVKNLVPNIEAAFIEIEKGYECYYSLTDNKNPIFINKKNNNKITIGDEIIVQVAKENIKTKQPVLTSNITLTGKYVVVSAGDKKLGISNKLSLKERQRVKELFAEQLDGEFGIIARTNIKNAAKEDVLREVQNLKNKLAHLIHHAKHRTCYSVLYEGDDNYISILKGLYEESLEQIVTDEKEIYQNIHTYLTNQNMDVNRYLLFYEDSLLPLYKLKNLESEIKNATQERIWLKSGAYLVIQPTEAFTVVDINTGKFTGKKNTQETFLKINLEAAKEIARQLRIRNISGIVVIDFIDLEKVDAKKQLMEEFDKILKKDPITTHLVGMSQLNLVELTRKKVRKSLREQVMEPCRLCHASGYISKKE
ncbi:ribonuclease E/G [Candidatus Galacturonibacter soehngenii]|uniref:Rne/Rng family ribonuclease n=1 Tax=Candidatus Galacturonatibacter soehngenii TaxID=2307010 RepID=UPI00177EB68A|nr:ribonuclease E/G [Candidatus Galacturonibacter soehngenii]